MCVCSIAHTKHILPGGDRILFRLMYAGLSGYCDVFNVLLVNTKVGSMDGNGDASFHGPKKRDDLEGERLERSIN